MQTDFIIWPSKQVVMILQCYLDFFELKVPLLIEVFNVDRLFKLEFDAKPQFECNTDSIKVTQVLET